jgi:hypothetical protein
MERGKKMKTLELCDFTEILVSVCNYCNNEKPVLCSNSSFGEYEGEYICFDCIELAFESFETVKNDEEWADKPAKCPKCKSDKIEPIEEYTICDSGIHRNRYLYCFGDCDRQSNCYIKPIDKKVIQNA